MAVADASWWGVWWPWLLVWGITVVSLIAAVAIVIGHWRRHRARASTRLRGISFYLDNESVMDLFHQQDGKYKAPLQQEVQERIIRNRKFTWSAPFAWIGGRAESDVSSDVVRSYIEKAEPITVIGIVIDVLDRADDIVNVDLRNREVISNRALDKALGTDDDRPTTVHLRDLNALVSIRGRFRVTDRTPAVTTLEAPYGDLTDPTDGPQVRLTCTTSGLRRTDVPTGTFPARCLGHVEDWDPDTRRLNVLPIAIFR